jgi:hypothetical protein
MKTTLKKIICPCCNGEGKIERKGYKSDCPNARRHLYTEKNGSRVNYCIHCGKSKGETNVK